MFGWGGSENFVAVQSFQSDTVMFRARRGTNLLPECQKYHSTLICAHTASFVLSASLCHSLVEHKVETQDGVSKVNINIGFSTVVSGMAAVNVPLMEEPTQRSLSSFGADAQRTYFSK